MEITTKVLCKNCRHNRVFTDENGNMMIGECELDLPTCRPCWLQQLLRKEGKMVIDFDSRYCTLILNKLKTQVFFLEKPDLKANQVFPLVFDGLRVKGYRVRITSINTASINTLRSSDVEAEGFLYKDHFLKEVMREHQELDVDDKIFLVNFQIYKG